MQSSRIRRVVGNFDQTYLCAGQIAPAGVYWEVDSEREVQLDREGVLPATLNGRVALYIRKPATWVELSRASSGRRLPR